MFATISRSTRSRRRFSCALVLFALSHILSACGNTDAIKSQPAAEAFHQKDPSVVRVMSWNVKRNSILPPLGARYESFARIIRALDPDVIALQEVVGPDVAKELLQLMNDTAPLAEGASWHVHTVSDNAVLSRYPMQHKGGERVVKHPVPAWGLPNFHFGFATALVDLPERFGGKQLLLVAMHNKSGADDVHVRMRQEQSDSTVRWLREHSTVADGTPIIILGDLNVVPDASQRPLATLLSGDIVDEQTFGPDITIDWDGSDLADARPSHNGRDREFYTWRIDGLPFPPSALDRIIYTDSVMSVRRRFVLNTTTLSPHELAQLGLQESDSLYNGKPGNFDHLPLIADFEFGVTAR
jgi:endonuclease/exonuclease/phosphatase family metal-dependent hydrolase